MSCLLMRRGQSDRRFGVGTPHPPEHRTSSSVVLKGGACVPGGCRHKEDCGPSMDLSHDGEPLAIRRNEMGYGNDPKEKRWHACWRERRGEIAEGRYCEEEYIEHGMHACCGAPLPLGQLRVPVRTADPGTNAEAIKSKSQHGKADCFVELVEGKFQQEFTERYGDHKPPKRECRKYQPGRPPVKASQSPAPSLRLIRH